MTEKRCNGLKIMSKVISKALEYSEYTQIIFRVLHSN